MRWAVAVAVLMLLPSTVVADGDCADCHKEIQRHFSATAMATATGSDDFKHEWAREGQNKECLSCHAPSGSAGVVCTDCHGSGQHPFARLQVPDVCARCHDAPGESTVRRHKASLAAQRGLNCLSCHVKSGGPSHAFIGVANVEFLSRAANLHLALRQENGRQVLLAAVRPRTGHALPGGTTGRSVWLIVRGIGKDGLERWREVKRFGWVQRQDGVWEDATLAPDIGANLELFEPGQNDAYRIEAQLVYRFRPGPLEAPDPKQVTIGKAQMTLRQ
jgi:hypothetical protein